MSVVLISGASGLLGRAIYSAFKSCEDVALKTIGLGFSRCSDEMIKCDLTSASEVAALFERYRANFFVHCAAERRPDVVEKNDSAKAINISATEILVKKCMESNCVMIFISTDYVFDGANPPYNESSATNPLNSYGLQKAEGEKIVLAASSKNIVVRVPVLYGPLNKDVGLDESAVSVLFKAVKLHSIPSKMDDVAIRYPTLTTDIGLFIVKLVVAAVTNNQDLKGVYHFSGKEAFTKYEMAVQMASIFNLPSSHLTPDKTSALIADTRRPMNSMLSCQRIKDHNLIVPLTSFEEGVKACLIPFI